MNSRMYKMLLRWGLIEDRRKGNGKPNPPAQMRRKQDATSAHEHTCQAIRRAAAELAEESEKTIRDFTRVKERA